MDCASRNSDIYRPQRAIKANVAQDDDLQERADEVEGQPLAVYARLRAEARVQPIAVRAAASLSSAAAMAVPRAALCTLGLPVSAGGQRLSEQLEPLAAPPPPPPAAADDPYIVHVDPSAGGAWFER